MLIEAHKRVLEASAIDIDLATTCGIHSITHPNQLPDNLSSYQERGLGIAFPWFDYLTGEKTYQIRLDKPFDEGTPRERKYIWPKGVTQKLAEITSLNQDPERPVLLIEGYKQAMAVYSTLGTDEDYLILAMAGCYGTSNIDTSGLEDKDVIVFLDADLRKKVGVWEAADGIGHQLKSVGCTVRYVIAPGTGSQGIDDCLAARKTLPWRKKLLDRLIREASMELPAKPNVTPITAARSATPPPPSGSDLFDPLNNKFLPVAAAERFLPNCAIFDGPEGPFRRYDNGVYREFRKDQLNEELALLCGNAFSTGQTDKTWPMLRGLVRRANFFPSEFMAEPWLNTPSGLVHLRTGEFRDHDPSLYSTVQIGTNYVADAPCPTFDAWIADMAGDQADTLMEYFAQLLDPTCAPAKHIILEGPPGSGKSTMIRIIQSVISGHFSGLSPFSSSLTMHQLNEGGFHTRQLVGRLFNSAGELKAEEINDITEFKMLTGDDAVTANVKNGDHITFRPRALFCFAMNEFPKIRDAEPYFRRVAPFRFENQKGKDAPDQSIENRIRNHELPGVLNRLVEARRRTYERTHLPGVRRDVVIRFQGETNPVLAWFHSAENPFPVGWHPIKDVYNTYRACMVEQGAEYDSPIIFSKRLEGGVPGVVKERKRIKGQVARCVWLPPREGFTNDDPDDDDPEPPSSPPDEPVDPVDPVPPVITEADYTEMAEYYENNPIEVIPNTVMTREEINQEFHKVTVTPIDAPQQGPVVTFDMETESVSMFWDCDPMMYPRLVGWKVDDGEVRTADDDISPLLDTIKSAGVIVGQNVIDFDLLALHRAGVFDLNEVVAGQRLVVDTMILARQLDPPGARQSKAARPYSLRNLAEKNGIPLDKDVLKKLAKQYDTSGAGINDPEFTGYGEIPTDDPEYVEYLKKDVEVTLAVLKAESGTNFGKLTDPTVIPRPDSILGYLRREHRVAAIAAMTRFHGVRVDEALLKERVSLLDDRRAALLSTLVTDYGLPTEGKAPHTTDVGKSAIRKAMMDAGMGENDQPVTDKGSYSFSGESMQAIIDKNPGNTTLRELCEVVAELNGQRTVYHTVMDNLKDDGRVHPDIDFRQATGRWSITDPGMTVMGKRGVNAAEREIFLPDEGCVFISADFAQVDARCVAAHSQDPEYLKLFQSGRDLHTEVALAVFHDGSPEKRQLAKAVGHGWNYGGSPRALAASSGANLEDVIAFDKAAKDRFLGVVDWQNEVRAIAIRGELLNNGFGRLLRCDPDRAHTQAPALVGQSCARDIAMEALLRMEPEVRSCLRLFVHDEFIFSIPEDKVTEYCAEIERAMTFEWRGVPFFGEPGKPAANWHLCYEK
jgi:DNA polymerase-1